MYDYTKCSKSEKTLRWRLELSKYDYEIIYKPGKYNFVQDTVMRAYYTSVF